MRLFRVLAPLVLALASLAAAALPTVDAVQDEVRRGNWAQAESMMQEVVAARPDSARAHYVYAEILAHNRRFDAAAAEAARARRIDPKLGFTDPAKFTAFEQALERQAAGGRAATVATPAPIARAVPAPAVRQPEPGVPGWVWVFGLAGVAGVVFVLVNRRRAALAAQPAMAGGGVYPSPAAPMPNPVGTGWSGGAPSQGPGLMGVGLAAAGGVAAGMLAERLLHGSHDAGPVSSASASPAGGLVPGMFDDDATAGGVERGFEQREIDFGRGDGWGGSDGGSDAGGGDDGW